MRIVSLKPDFRRHYDDLERFIAAVREWERAKRQGPVPDDVMTEVLQSLAGAELALQASNVRFHLYSTPTTREANSLQEGVYFLKDTAVPRFGPMLDQLDHALGRIRVQAEAAEAEAEAQIPPVTRNPVRRVINLWSAASLVYKGLGVLATVGGGLGVGLAVWRFLF